MIRPILIHPAPILRDTSAPVPEINDWVRTLLDDMLETMYDAQGLGLAAVQIGVLQRLVVIDTDWKEGARNPLFFVNPEIGWSSTTTESREERCLSIPNTPKEVIRPDRVRVRYLDRDGLSRETEMTGLMAMVIQHEVDHLEGVLILDRAA
ncbi:MAG TPA: peptide deformylase [Roseiarcus sp.]|jgi:peptide deformylase